MPSARRAFALIAIALALAAVASAQVGERMANVDGHCYLLGQSDHSGSKIRFTAESPSAETDSTYTDVLGYYAIGLSEGIYSVRCTHNGYLPYPFIDTYTFATGSYTLPDAPLLGPAIEVSGEVSGDWTTDYIAVVGELSVPEGDTLVVHSGVSVMFMGDFTLAVEGALHAVGTVGDSVRFMSGLSERNRGDWRGIEVTAFSGGGLNLEGCVIEDAGSWGGGGYRGAIVAYNTLDAEVVLRGTRVSRSAGMGVVFGGPGLLTVTESTISHVDEAGVDAEGGYSSESSLTIRSTTVSDCGAEEWGNGIGIRVGGFGDSVVITNNYLEDTHGAGIELHADTGSSTSISDNVIVGANSIGIDVDGATGGETVEILRNLLIGEPGVSGSGIFIDGGEWAIRGNTIVDWDSGINLSGGPLDVTVENTAIVGCEYGVFLGNDAPINVALSYNDLWECTQDFYGDDLPPDLGVVITVNANGDPSDAYYNIFLDPMFVGGGDYHLTGGSSCIDAGNPDPQYYDPDGTVADIGAYPYVQGPLVPPAVTFEPSGTFGVSPYPVEFVITNSGGPITSWSWDFGDGSSSGVPRPVHTYVVLDSTTFTVALQVAGPGGTDSIVYPGLITVLPASTPPVAEFTADPVVGYGVVQFTDLSTGQIDNWDWDFGNGDTSTEQHPLYEYASTGTYTVTLTVSGSHGSEVEEKIDYITILPPETVVAGFEASVTHGVAPLAVWFTNTSEGPITSYAWDFGDSTYSGDENPQHTYLGPGTYEVTLVATGPANSDTAAAFIAVGRAEALILDIIDVPDDQGTQVYVQFEGSGYDGGGVRPSELYTVERNDDGIWTAVAAGGAYGQEFYQFLAPTLRDSTESDDGLTEFRIVATMDEGNFVSASAWGYSVDNIAPGVPTGFTLVQLPPDGNSLSWNPCPEWDFQYFKVYRDDSEGFQPAPANLVHQTIETQWLDPNGTDLDYYKISAVDHAGNESDPASPEIMTGVDDAVAPTAFVLYQNAPNPIVNATSIRYDVPAGTGDVTVEIFDISGRLVRTLVSGQKSPGRKTVLWDATDDGGRRVASGVYLCRLRGGAFEKTLKMTLLR